MKTITNWADLWGFTPYPKQEAFLRTPKNRAAFIGGFGSGKSWANAARCVLAVLESAEWSRKNSMTGISDGIVVCPTYDLCVNVMSRALEEINDSMVAATGHGIISQVNKSKMEIITHWGSKILLRSATRCQNLVGLNLGWAAMDEVTTMAREEEVFDLLQARLRCPKMPPGRRSLWISTTPQGYTGCIRRLGELRKADESAVCMIRAASHDNPHLDPTFIESLRATYSKARWKAEVLGEVSAPTTAIFPEFSAKHVIPWVQHEGDWIAGADWGLTRHHFLEIDVVELDPGIKTYVVVGEHFTPNESIDRQNRWWHELKARRHKHPIAVGIDRADNWKQGRMVRQWGWRTKQNDDSRGMAARVLPGVELIRDLLDPADGGPPRLYLSDKLVREGRQDRWSIFYCLQEYKWMLAPDGISPIDAVQRSGHEHAIDSLRYAILSQEKWRTTRGYYALDTKPRPENALRIV
tara:strand:- start:1247 stop:2647 length:1401 start_codon:yes stop_codon:yes gene_type:complete